MKSSNYLRILFLASTLILGACDENPSFAGVGAGDGPGVGGGPGGGTGGGGSTTEPRMAIGPGQSPGFGGILIAGDATEVVFVDDANPLGSNPNEEWQLWSFNLSTNDLVQITDGSATAVPALFDFDITDSGASVVWVSSDDFAGTNPNNQFNVFMAATDGTGINQVTAIDAGFATNPKVSGMGSIVVFSSDTDLTGDNPANDTQIFSINSDGSNLTQVTNLRLVPNNLWISDDGSTIAFEGVGDPFGTNADGSWEIFAMDIDGANLAQLTVSDGDSFVPKLSDNGSLVAFTSQEDLVPGGNTDGNYELFVAQTDGSGTVQISNGDSDSGTFMSGAPGSFDISGNGSYVVFASGANLTGENANLNHTIYWASAAGGGAVSQLLRDGTVADGATNRTADQPGMTNDGFGIVFESDQNLTSDTQPAFDKIYTTIRQ